ncbi:MAG: MarR family transcriptional regulator [Mycetocola sp.]
MSIEDDAVEVRTQGWRTLAALHGMVESELERALQAAVSLSAVEFTVLDALSRQQGWHMRMQQLSHATALSPSATTRLVNRLEDRNLLTRILCADDRRGIYTELTEAGSSLLGAARPVYNDALERALAAAAGIPELAPLVEGLPGLLRVPQSA